MTEQPVPTRQVQFEYPDDFRAMWHPYKPEFAAACAAALLEGLKAVKA